MSLKNKLLILILFASLIPVIFIGVFSFNVSEDALIDKIGTQSLEYADLVVERVNSYLYEKLNDIRSWSKMDLIFLLFKNELSDVTDFFKIINESFLLYDRISLIGKNGKIIASSDIKMIGIDNSQEEWFRRSIAGEEYITDVIYDNYSKDYDISFSVPIKDKDNNQEIIGVVRAVMRWDDINKMITHLKVRGKEQNEHDHIMMAKRDGTIISGSITRDMKDRLFKDNLLPLSSAQNAIEGRKGFIIERSEHNLKSLTAYTFFPDYLDMPNPKWIILIDNNYDEITASAAHIKRNIIFMITGIIPLLLLLSYIFSGRISRPILNIASAAENIGKGELGQLIEVQSKDEVGILAKSFNKMTTDLKKAKEVEMTIDAMKREKDAASIADKAKSQFLTHMSHEMRTPLNGIIGLTNILLSLPGTPEQREHLRAIETSSDHLMVLINDLLDLSKIEAGKLQLINTDFSIRDLFNEIAHEIGILAEKKGVKFYINSGSDLPEYVSGDKNRLKQILINILGNAFKFTEKGSVSVKADCEYLEKDNGNSPSCRIKFIISDTGIGISEEYLEKIFSPFTQADTSFQRRYQGTGLGLNISKRLLEAMGGSISVKSKLGEGSIFEIFIPFNVSRKMPNKEISENGSIFYGELPQNLRILIAEDNTINQKVALALIERKGWRAELASNGKEAVNLFASQRFDLILMDIQMPEMDGIEATRHIRSIEKGNGGHIPIIAMTANAMKEELDSYISSGMDAYIVKPMKIETFYPVVSHVITEQEKETA